MLASNGVDKRGKLIVIDGSDGVGKATQTDLLVDRLKKHGVKVRTLDFPRYESNFFGAFIRECLHGRHGSFVDLDPYLASIPYAADRFESRAMLEKWLKNGVVVILNRYVSSNQMHQGGKIRNAKERARFLKWLDTIEHRVFGLPRPDVIVYLHVPVKISLALLAKRGGKKDQHESDPRHLADAQESALKLIEARGNWQKIECAYDGKILPREDIHEKVCQCIGRMIRL